ncbi:thioredoxin fold domain-containing protein [candidate division WOR-3 bacterium]|uniref:Thioredoxin fold domain-containing protein n=1 Tax=candidate division WOR-3 bacterium TaxID=2052148 RepID=A0A9D5KBN2_UNCW3|nr:thioredoxin fold domain-containing protein [candidate division WOR-3 bacterium]MBD3365224.1 thioredoxin fold domain-containing protein [candidate division WOR-3 bacterium]
MEKKTRNIILIVVLVALVTAVTAIVLVKGNANKTSSVAADSLAQDSVYMDTGATATDSIVQIDSATGEVVVVKQQPEPDYLVMVNGRKITEDYFNERVGKLMADGQKTVREHPKGFLDQLVTEELLIAEAERRELGDRDEQNPTDLIYALEKDVTSSITVSDAEIRAYYDEHKEDMQGMTYEQAKDGIGDFLRNQKKTNAFNELLTSLKSNTEVAWNNQWLARHTADDPLSRALSTGRPVVADFGQSSCIPCKKMLPILQELQSEYHGKAEILILDTRDYGGLAGSVGVRVIPTQIFYDRNGNEVYRHVGFMEKQAIVDQLKKMGVN